MVCRYGQGIVRELFKRLKKEDIKGFIVWIPMMASDNKKAAIVEAQSFGGLNVVHYWDDNGELGNMFAKALFLKYRAWDIYCLYSRSVVWEEDSPPNPAFWMHQLPSSLGADNRLVLNPNMFSQELFRLLESTDNPDYADLGFELHVSALTNLAKKGQCHTMEDLRRTLMNPEVKHEKI